MESSHVNFSTRVPPYHCSFHGWRFFGRPKSPTTRPPGLCLPLPSTARTSLVAADNKKSGCPRLPEPHGRKIIWKVGRPKNPLCISRNYELDGRQQLIMTGCDPVSSYNPVSGDKLWEIKGATT